MIPLGEKHLRRILAEWVMHYNQGRPHLNLGPGTPEPAAVFLPQQGHERHSFAQDCKVVARAVLGGLHHEVGSCLTQVHLNRELESNDYDRSCQTTIYIG